MDKKVWIIGGVIILGGATAYILLNKKAAAAATVVTEPYTDNPVSTSEQIATTNTPAVIAAIPDSSFVGVTANGTTINTNTTPVGTTYSKYPVGSQLTFSNSSVAGRIYTVTAIQSGYYVMSYSGGGPLTIQVTIVDTDSAWGLYVPGVSATPAPAAPGYVAPATGAAAATQNGTIQTVITPDTGNGSGTETIATYGLGTDSPYEIINGQIVYI